MSARLFLALILLALPACRCGGAKLTQVLMPPDSGLEVPGADGGCVPSAETCNGLDADCTGKIDAGLPMTSGGVGACAHSAPACSGGAPATCLPLAPTAEVCDGQDNDCDGQTDEDL